MNYAFRPQADEAAAPGHPGAGKPSRLRALERKKRPIAVNLAFFFIAIAVVIVLLGGWSRYRAYGSQLEESQVASVNIARATAEHAEKTFDLVDAILYGITERVQTDGVGEAALPRLQRFLIARVVKMPCLQGLFVFDSKGDMLLSSFGTLTPASNNLDGEYFRFHRADPSRAIHIGKPIRSRTTGTWVLPVSRRIDAADGSFDGVVLATVPVSYFQQYYDGFDIGKGGAILMSLDDATLLTRRPFVDSAIGSDGTRGPVFSLVEQFGTHGSGVRLAQLDNVVRLYSFQKIKPYPLVVAAALSREEIFVGWWSDNLREAALVVAMIAVLLGVGYRLLRQILIRDRLEEELREVQAALEQSVVELDRLSKTDALTGLANRRFLSARMEREVQRASREQLPIALVMLDIDYFKRYNDHYGHPAGDACLKKIAGVIAAAANRPADVAARYGGEEFALLLPNTDADGAHAVAERICAEVAALAEPHPGVGSGVVSISAGATACVPAGLQAAEAMLAAADRALYAAKAAGRNQVKRGEHSCTEATVGAPAPG